MTMNNTKTYRYCSVKNRWCESATINGYCSLTACYRRDDSETIIYSSNGVEYKQPCSFCIDHDKDDYIYDLNYTDAGYSFDHIKMKYCPVCGRKLEE